MLCKSSCENCDYVQHIDKHKMMAKKDNEYAWKECENCKVIIEKVINLKDMI